MSICFLFIANPWPRVKSEGDPANLSCLLFLVSCDSQVLPALKTQEKKLKQQLLGQRQEVQELEMNIESMSIEIREPPSLGNSKVVCGHCHHCGHRNNITKPCELKKCTEYTYCGLKDKHPEYFSKLNSLKVELKKKKATLKEIESQMKSMEDFSTSSEFSFVKNLTPRMYAANPAYKTNKAKLMRDVHALRTFLDGKIPCVTANDSEQLNILILNSKKNLGVSSDGDETYGTKSTIQTKLDFDSSHVSPIKTEVMEGNSDKVSQVFPRVLAVRTERKSLNIPDTKRPRKIGGGGNILAILAVRVRKTIHGTLRDIQAALSLTLSTVFPVKHKDTLIQCHSFINPYNLIHKRAEFNKDFSWLIPRTTLCKIQLCTTVYRLEVQK